MGAHDHKFERILLLQKDMQGRLEKLEGSWACIFECLTASEMACAKAVSTSFESAKVTRSCTPR